MADRDIYPTFLRTTGAAMEMESFLEEVVRAFGWTRLTVVHGNGVVWLDTADEFAVRAMYYNTETMSHFFLSYISFTQFGARTIQHKFLSVPHMFGVCAFSGFPFCWMHSNILVAFFFSPACIETTLFLTFL